MKTEYTDLTIRGNRIEWQVNGKPHLFIMDALHAEWEIREWMDSLSPEDMDEHRQTACKLMTFGELNLLFNETYS